MFDLLWCATVSVATGVVAALLTEWGYVAHLRRRCWRAERTLTILRGDPEGQACLERLAALRARDDDA